MSRTVVDAELEAYKPGDATPFVTIPGEDIATEGIDRRAQDAMDGGTLQIHNHERSYSGSGEITSGDKLVFRVQLQGESSLSDRWTAIARKRTDVLQGGRRQRIEISATDFPFTILSWRLAYDSFDDAQITGSSDAILETLLDDEATEIDQTQITSVPDTTDAFYNGRSLLDIVRQDLAPIADAIVGNDGEALTFEPVGDVSAKHQLSPSDFQGEISIPRNDAGVANLVRVDGGTDHAVDDEQATQSGYTTVTSSNRLATQIDTRKSETARVQIWTNPTGSQESVIVRLQADRSGSPVDITDTTSDIARKQLSYEFLANDGFTTFILPAHTLPPNENPWLIVESDGSSGQDIGVDGSGNLAYKAEYPYPLLTRLPFRSSQDEYRRRDHRIKDDSLETEAAVRDLASSYGRHHDAPEKQLSGQAKTLRAHNLQPAEAVDMTDWDGVSVSGKWLVLQRSTQFDGQTNRMETTLTLQEADTV